MKRVICSFMKVVYLLALLNSCNGQAQTINQNQSASAGDVSNKVGGDCDGCELMYVDMPANILSTDTSSGWYGTGQKLLVTGTVFKLDGKTPAPNVIIYYWQTDNSGYYTPKNGMEKAARQHGHVRGWVKTDSNGKYSIYTVRPSPYPGRRTPAHIHTSIKEPHIDNEYYIDEFVFDDDRLLTSSKRKAHENRGGSGILRVMISGDLQIAKHNIVLGLNIPNYPEEPKSQK